MADSMESSNASFANEQISAARNVAEQAERAVGSAKSIVERLKESLPKGTVVDGSFKKGGTVPKTGPYQLHRGETVIPASRSQPADASQPQQGAPAQPQDPQAPTAAQPDATAPAQDAAVSLPDDNAIAGTTNLHRAFSKLNEALVKLADECAVKRSATIAHQEGQPMSEHIADVGRILNTTGGLTANLILATHSKFGPNGGATVAYPAEKLRQTVIPKDDANAKASIAACRSFVNKCAGLIGQEDPSVKRAKGQLDLIGQHDGSGMSLSDLLIALVNVPSPVIAAVARAHSGTKDGGHAPHLRAPRP